MSTIDKWIDLTDARLDRSNVCLESKFVGRLSAEEYEEWVLRQEDAPDYQDWYPIQVDWPGHMIRAYYINLNRKSDKHGQIYCLAVFCGSGEHEFVSSGRVWRQDDPRTPPGGVRHKCEDKCSEQQELKSEH